MNLKKIILILTLLPVLACANPVTMLNQAATQLLASVAAHQESIKKNPAALDHMVQSYLLPHVDEQGMARRVLGPKYWDQATPEQQKAFIQEFTRLLTKTYAVALASSENQTLRFLPQKSQDHGGTQMTVYSLLMRPGMQPIPINYYLAKRGTEWKVYNFTVDGISFVNNYRSQFEAVLESKGLEGLLVQLRQHNLS